MASEVEVALSLAFKAAEFVAGIIARFIEGDDSAEVRRVMDVLSPELRADAELERQRVQDRKALVDALGTDPG